MIAALLIITGVAFVFEIAGLLYCAIRNLPFGRAFGAAVFVQISIPATILAASLVWEYFSPTTIGIEPFAGTGFARGFLLYLILLIAGYIATLAAGSLGFCRIFLHANDNTRNA